ncbi:MAG: UDP-N-acetylmuramoyl-L-alanyl-D-glutamate--2,6-diaminopimelate ligase [Thermodesulfobacteriota bacterium]
MLISTLITSLSSVDVLGNIDVDIEGVAYNSNDVKDGFLFAAMKGERFDGHHFLRDACKKGAKAVVVKEFVKGLDGITQIRATDTRDTLARLSSVFYGEPSRRLRLIGVTGTNGKTSTAFILESILKQAGRKTGIIGTIDYHFSGRRFKAANTTPESLDLQRLLHDMVENGVEDCIMEVSSHALTMKRVEGCTFEGAIFTNLSQDHLDFHGDMEGYFQAKATLFKDILRKDSHRTPFSTINIDDPKAEGLISSDKTRMLTYGMDNGADIWPEEVSFSEDGIRGVLKTPAGSIRVISHLIGDFNLYNIMAATGAGISLNIPIKVIETGIEVLKGVKGRMERLSSSRDGFDIVIDYAHTADALEKVILSIRAFKKGRLITVFGCGGERDKGKRRVMGRVSAEGSDITILTSDNPRGEEPNGIIKDIETGLKEMSIERLNTPPGSEIKGYMVNPDRREAIYLAITMARDRDTVLIAGKGHEGYQIIGKETIPFDDRIEAEKALEERELWN